MRLRRPEIDPAPYVTPRTYGTLGWLEHLDGIPWDEAPIPSRRHRCWPQTRLHDSVYRELTERCACGAIRLGRRRPWIERNTRRPPTREEAQAKCYYRSQGLLMEQYKAAERAGDRPRIREIRARLKTLLDEQEALRP